MRASSQESPFSPLARPRLSHRKGFNGLKTHVPQPPAQNDGNPHPQPYSPSSSSISASSDRTSAMLIRSRRTMSASSTSSLRDLAQMSTNLE